MATAVTSAPRAALCMLDTLTPFLYPCLYSSLGRPCARRQLHLSRSRRVESRQRHVRAFGHSSAQLDGSTAPESRPSDAVEPAAYGTHLNPAPDSYAATPFADNCTLTLHAGAGGHGCVSFLREKYIEHGPPNGGDGGSGGNIYIQAVKGETSLHKLSRRGSLLAGRGRNGRGKGQGGERGEDVLFTVPVGTVVRELWRVDPVEEERLRVLEERRRQKAIRAAMEAASLKESVEDGEENAERQAQDQDEEKDFDSTLDTAAPRWKREKWIAYPGMTPREMRYIEAPTLPRKRTTTHQALQPLAPITLDLDAPMDRPMLLAAGASGGVGNPHFVTPATPRPKFATRGDPGMRLGLSLELKMLADVGLVGLPNAGKSTLLRAISASRTRVGSWAFTTLQPVIGTVVLDSNKGRPSVMSQDRVTGELRTSFTVADIPGLIEDAHQNKGLGLGFLRHIERAKVLAFVVDLGAGDAVAALKSLWSEVGAYETLRARELHAESESRLGSAQHEWVTDDGRLTRLPSLVRPPVSAKPWFVVASKADRPGAQAEFERLRDYVARVERGSDASRGDESHVKSDSDTVEAHPSGHVNAWRRGVTVVPVSAIRGEGVAGLPGLIARLLDG